MTSRSEHAEVVRRTGGPRLLEWLEHELPFFPSMFPGVRSLDLERAMRCEEVVEDGKFVLRAELPGIDPDKDVEVTVSEGVLRIRAQRRAEHKEKRRTEFFYGELARTIVLPKGVDEGSVTASYRDGILEVTVPMAAEDAPEKRIPVTRPE